jgi:hypothetical protein
MQRPISRADPAMPVRSYQTYTIFSPRDTLLRAACEQVGCPAWRNGWQTVLDEGIPQFRDMATWIRTASRRTFREQKTNAGLTVFTFGAGQRCFANHQTRPETYAVRRGDWRQNLGVLRRHTRPADWVEDFGEHQQRVADQQQKG